MFCAGVASELCTWHYHWLLHRSNDIKLVPAASIAARQKVQVILKSDVCYCVDRVLYFVSHYKLSLLLWLCDMIVKGYKGHVIAVNGIPSHSYWVSLAISYGIIQCYLSPGTSEHTPP